MTRRPQQLSAGQITIVARDARTTGSVAAMGVVASHMVVDDDSRRTPFGDRAKGERPPRAHTACHTHDGSCVSKARTSRWKGGRRG